MIIDLYLNIHNLNFIIKGDLVLAMSITENRIHIYSTEDYSLKHCLGDDIIVERIKISIFSKKRNYVAFLFDNFTIQIFDLNYIIKSDNQICTCNATAKRRNSMNKLVKKHSYDHINKVLYKRT